MITTGQTLTKFVTIFLAVASSGAYSVPPRSLAAQERANQQAEQAPSPLIGQKVVTKYVTPLKSGGKVVDDGAVFRIFTAIEVDRDVVKIESGDVSGWAPASEIVLLSQAIEFYNQEIKNKPGNHETLRRRGFIWESKSEYDKAIADFTEATKLAPKVTAAFLDRGRVFLEHKKAFNEASADFSEAIKLDPKCVRAYVGRASARNEKEEFDDAIAQLLKVGRNIIGQLAVLQVIPQLLHGIQFRSVRR